MATCISGDPVSPSFVPYSLISECLRSAVIDTELTPFAIEDPRRSKTAVFDPDQSDHCLRVPNRDNRTLVEAIQAGPHTDFLRRYPLATSQSDSFSRRQGQGREVVQRSLERKQIPRSNQTMPTLRHGIQRNRLRFAERSDRKTTQLGNVANGPEPDSEITH